MFKTPPGFTRNDTVGIFAILAFLMLACLGVSLISIVDGLDSVFLFSNLAPYYASGSRLIAIFILGRLEFKSNFLQCVEFVFFDFASNFFSVFQRISLARRLILSFSGGRQSGLNYLQSNLSGHPA